MNRYVIANPRTLFGFAAVAMTALTFMVAVVLPATLTEAHVDESSPVAAGASALEAAAMPLKIEVFAVREQATAQAVPAVAKQGQRS